MSEHNYPVIATASVLGGFKNIFDKVCINSADEVRRWGTFEMSAEFIKEESAKGLGYSLGVNQFSDLLRKEWSAQCFGITSKPAQLYGVAPKLGVHKWNGEALLASVDWTEKGIAILVNTEGSVVLLGFPQHAH